MKATVDGTANWEGDGADKIGGWELKLFYRTPITRRPVFQRLPHQCVERCGKVRKGAER